MAKGIQTSKNNLRCRYSRIAVGGSLIEVYRVTEVAPLRSAVHGGILRVQVKAQYS